MSHSRFHPRVCFILMFISVNTFLCSSLYFNVSDVPTASIFRIVAVKQ